MSDLDDYIESKIAELGIADEEEQEQFRDDVTSKVDEFKHVSDKADDFKAFNFALGYEGALGLIRSLLKAAKYTSKRIEHILSNLAVPYGVKSGTSLEISYTDLETNTPQTVHLCSAEVPARYDETAAWERLAKNITTKELEVARANQGMILKFCAMAVGMIFGENPEIFEEMKKRLPGGVDPARIAMHRHNNTMSFMDENTALVPRIGVVVL